MDYEGSSGLAPGVLQVNRRLCGGDLSIVQRIDQPSKNNPERKKYQSLVSESKELSSFSKASYSRLAHFNSRNNTYNSKYGFLTANLRRGCQLGGNCTFNRSACFCRLAL
jgi:hypothetical protein